MKEIDWEQIAAPEPTCDCEGRKMLDKYAGLYRGQEGFTWPMWVIIKEGRAHCPACKRRLP